MTIRLPRIELFTLVPILISCAHQVLAQVPDGDGDADDVSYSSNPVLDYQPVFSASIVTQVFLTGIIFTLTSVLLLHLLFTAQYHWPLAPVNFVLQVSGVVSLLVTQIATIHVVISTTMLESQNWPYMLTYIAVDVPPLVDNSGWTTAELVSWLTMNAATSGLIQITHIQFLTLLYPSPLEKRLILSLLGPVAIVSAVMELLPFQSQSRLVDWADAVRNVCNATLSLLFTLSLVLWGFFVKRESAWRTDGGTAAFGAGAIVLAVASTGLTFAFIPEDNEFDWLLGLSRAVILWQSFLGWWWWVGSGMAIYSPGLEGMEEMLRREEKKDQKRKARKARRSARKEKAKTFLKGVTVAFTKPRSEEAMEEQDRPSETSDSSIHQDSIVVPDPPPPTEVSTRASDVAYSPVSRFFMRWYLLLRNEHRTADREQAEERTERVNRAYNGGRGWGLGSFATRRRDGERELSENETDREGEHDAPPNEIETQPSSVSWWNPLRKWRLQDTTVY